MKKTRIEYPTGTAISFKDLPIPKFKVGDMVHRVNYLGEIKYTEIKEIHYSVSICDNNYKLFIDYDFKYQIGYYDFESEEDLYVSLEEATKISESVILDRNLKLKTDLKENIEKQTKNLFNLIEKLKNLD